MKTNRGNISKRVKIVIFSVIMVLSILLPENTWAIELDSVESISMNETKVEEMDGEKVLENASMEEELLMDTEITREELFTKNSWNMEYQKDKVLVKGNIQEYMTVLDILEKIDRSTLENEYSITKIGVTGSDNTWLLEDNLITSDCHLVFIGEDFVACYMIQIAGDLNQDQIVNEEDVEYGMDKVLEEEQEETENSINPEDVSYVHGILKENTYEVILPVEEKLINEAYTLEEEHYVGETTTIEYKIHGFEQNHINTISGKLDYNHEMLLLDSIFVMVDGKVVGRLENDKFLYLLDTYHSNNLLLRFQFHNLKSGSSTINFQELKAMMNGVLLDLEAQKVISIFIQEYGKGGNIEDNSNTIKPIVTPQKEKYTTPQKVISLENKIPHQTITTILLSNDNYIKNLEIKGYSISFNKDIMNYSLEVDSTVDSLQFNVTLNHDNAAYYITGNKLKQGKNKVILTVRAEDGSSRNYVITVYKKKEEIKNNKSLLISKQLKRIILLIILMIMIITIVGIIYHLLKEED